MCICIEYLVCHPAFVVLQLLKVGRGKIANQEQGKKLRVKLPEKLKFQKSGYIYKSMKKFLDYKIVFNSLERSHDNVLMLEVTLYFLDAAKVQGRNENEAATCRS